MLYIVLSTYNGSKYLQEQLNSIKSQDYSDWKMLIRDDGSTDTTRNILSQFANSLPNKIQLFFGDNIGWVASYFMLIQLLPHDCEYVSFCDQDDVWKPNKLSLALKSLQISATSSPLLYCSRVEVVDETLGSPWIPDMPSKKLSLANAVFDTYVQGCTVVINKSALNVMLQTLPNCNNCISHDIWMNLLLSSVGIIIYDHHATMLYRQHMNSTVGRPRGIKALKRKILFLFHTLFNLKPATHITKTRQIREFKRTCYHILSAKNQQTIDYFLQCADCKKLLPRIKLIMQSPFYKQNAFLSLVLKIIWCIREI